MHHPRLPWPTERVQLSRLHGAAGTNDTMSNTGNRTQMTAARTACVHSSLRLVTMIIIVITEGGAVELEGGRGPGQSHMGVQE